MPSHKQKTDCSNPNNVLIKRWRKKNTSLFWRNAFCLALTELCVRHSARQTCVGALCWGAAAPSQRSVHEALLWETQKRGCSGGTSEPVAEGQIIITLQKALSAALWHCLLNWSYGSYMEGGGFKRRTVVVWYIYFFIPDLEHFKYYYVREQYIWASFKMCRQPIFAFSLLIG